MRYVGAGSGHPANRIGWAAVLVGRYGSESKVRPRMILGLLIGLLTFLCTSCGRAPLSSPTASRNSPAYQEALNSAPTGPVDPSLFNALTVTNVQGALSLTWIPAPNMGNQAGLPHRLVRLKPGAALTGTNQAFRLAAIGVGYPTESQAGSVPLTFYTPAGRPMTPAQKDRLGLTPWQLKDHEPEANFPALVLFFGDTNRPPGYYSPIGLFDARTYADLTSGFGYSQVGKQSLGRLTLHPRLWHATPMKLILNVELNGRVTRDLAVASRARVKIPGGQVMLVGIWNGLANSWSSSGSRMTMRLQPAAGKSRCVAVLATLPTGLAVHTEFLDSEKRVIRNQGGGSAGNIRLVDLSTNAAAVRWARFTVYTNQYHVVLPLPPLPDLPLSNRKVRDLFQVRVPRVHFEYEFQLRQFISDVTEMNFVYGLTNVIPPQYFPATFTNTTPLALLDQYRRFLPVGYRFVVDPPKHQIRVELTKFAAFWRWLKQRLHLH